MKKLYNRVLSSKLYLLVLLCAIWMNGTSCVTTAYYTPSGGSFTGTTSYCQGATAAANSFNYTECSGTGTGSSGVACTAQWYYNTTGGTSIGTSTALGGPVAFTSAAGGGGALTYTPLTTTTGTFYYFVYITWGTADCASPFTSVTQTINITAPISAITGTATVCVGNTTPLADASPGGGWASGSPGIATVSGAGLVTGIAAGTALISYTVGSCTATRIVTVTSSPPAITPATAAVICVGGTVAFSDASGGGTWTSGASGIATVSSSGLVTGIAGGITNITYSLGGACVATKPVTVNAAPAAITGSLSVCVGKTTTLTETSTGGAWGSGTTSVATVSATGVVSGVASGTSTVSYAGTCGAASVVVTVNPLPAVITGPGTVCEGGATITLSDATTGGTWASSTPGNATAAPATGVITGVAAGTTTITYTSLLSCVVTTVTTVKPLPGPITGTPEVCSGLTVTLANAIAGGTWSSGTPSIATAATITTATGTVTGVIPGTAIITYTNSCGMSTIEATVDPGPAPIVGRDTVCIGGTTAFADASIGGTWLSSNPAVATVLVGSGLITAVSTGVSYITYTMPGGCTSSDSVRVVPLPPAITGTTEVCVAATTILSNSMTGGIWSSQESFIANVGSSTGVVTGMSADVTTIYYKSALGCSVGIQVTVNPLPLPITGAIPKCATGSDTLFDATPGGTWSSATPGIATIGAATGIVSANSGGTAVIRYTLPTGCMITKNIIVYPLPAPSVNYDNATVTFSTDNTYLSYQWYNSLQGLIPDAVYYHTAAQFTGYYHVVVTDGNGCIGSSAPVYFDETTVGVKSNSKLNFRIYPNPTSEAIYIESPVKVRAVISGLDGKKELEQTDAKKMDITKLANGVYFITLYDDSGASLIVKKLIKE